MEDGDTQNACSTGAGALLHGLLGGRVDGSLDFLAALRNGDVIAGHARVTSSKPCTSSSFAPAGGGWAWSLTTPNTTARKPMAVR